MSEDFFTIFQPGLAHFKRWKEAEKLLFVDTTRAGRGRHPDDLESGSITIEVAPDPSPDAAGEEAQGPG